MLAFLILAQAATSPCGHDHDQIANSLRERFGETIAATATLDNGAPVETYSNPKTGTWTMILATPDGLFCMIANGQTFKALPQGEPT